MPPRAAQAAAGEVGLDADVSGTADGAATTKCRSGDRAADGAQDAERGWRAELELGFALRDTRSVLAHRRHFGPMMVQSAFYPEGDPCHVYILHPPAGLVAGDQLQLTAALEPRTHALLTTPAASKFYRSRRPGVDGPAGTIKQNLSVGRHAKLEWLPCESIVFDGANCDARTHIRLDPEAKLLAWEGWVFGRPACDERFATGSFAQQFEIYIDQRPVLVERNRVLADSQWMRQAWGLGGRPAMATVVAYPGGELALLAARNACLQSETVLASCTEIDGLVVCRVMAAQLPMLREQMERWWQALRPLVIDCAPVAPRIWAT